LDCRQPGQGTAEGNDTSKTQANACEGIAAVQANSLGTVLDDCTATKLTVGIVPAEHADATELKRWFLEGADIRNDADIVDEVLAFVTAAGAGSVVMTDKIIGCPHEEGLDYQGPTCPVCTFWAGRDRWTGEHSH